MKTINFWLYSLRESRHEIYVSVRPANRSGSISLLTQIGFSAAVRHLAAKKTRSWKTRMQINCGTFGQFDARMHVPHSPCELMPGTPANAILRSDQSAAPYNYGQRWRAPPRVQADEGDEFIEHKALDSHPDLFGIEI
jgi:hypothetical protein